MIPLACLFIRATLQTYQMLLSTRKTTPRQPATAADAVLAAASMALFLLSCFLVFLAVKLLLGVLLLRVAGRRVKDAAARARMHHHTGARRSSAFGTVMVTDEARRVIYQDTPDEGRKVAERERAGREREMDVGMGGLDGVQRYRMCSKRIW